MHENTKSLGRAGTVVRAAVTTAFSFLLGAGEYVANEGKGYLARTVLLGDDVELRSEGELAPVGARPDEATLRIRGSKTDQLNVGSVRTHHATGDEGGLCPALPWRKCARRFRSVSTAAPRPRCRCFDGQTALC